MGDNKNYFYLFIHFFSETRVQVRPVDGFLLDVKSHKDVPFRSYKT